MAVNKTHRIVLVDTDTQTEHGYARLRANGTWQAGCYECHNMWLGSFEGEQESEFMAPGEAVDFMVDHGLSGRCDGNKPSGLSEWEY